MPLLTVVACGAPLAARVPEISQVLTTAGWTVTVVHSDAAAQWLPNVARCDERVRPDGVLAFPLSFNSANKIAAGDHGHGCVRRAVRCAGRRGAGHRGADGERPALGSSRVDTDTRHPANRRGALHRRPHGAGRRAARRQEGSGAGVVSAFDPDWVVAALTS